jgi:hypothetical protein
MNRIYRILNRLGCVLAAIVLILLCLIGPPVDGNWIAYKMMGLPALACFALAWVVKPQAVLRRRIADADPLEAYR